MSQAKNKLGIHPIAGTDNPQRKLDLLFIHGLGGDAFTTWQYENKEEYFWPKGLGLEFPEIGVWTIAYGATPSKWVEDVMPMEDRAENLLNQFVANGIGKRPFTLVAHSMGGLIAKYILTQAEISNDPDYNEIATHCRGVVFLAVPHNGSGWSNILSYARVLVRGNKIVTQLAKDSSALRQLSKNFNQLSKRKNLVCHAFYETKEIRIRPKKLGFLSLPFSKGIKIVSESSAGDTALAKSAIPMDDDHLSICKLTSKNDQLYKNMQMILNDYLAEQQPEVATIEKKKTVDEVRKHRHWLYHTMAHDYFSHHSVIKYFQDQNYFVGFYTGDRDDMPYSFAVDYYSRLKALSMAEEVWEKILEIDLDGAGENSFRNGLHKKLLPKDYLRSNKVDLDETVKAKLKSEVKLVFNVQIDRRRDKKTDIIINGAINYLQKLDVKDGYIAVLFNGRSSLNDGDAKGLGSLLPCACNDMKSLRMLDPDDIEDWLEVIEKKHICTAKLEQALSPLKVEQQFPYKTALARLETLPPAEVLKGKYL